MEKQTPSQKDIWVLALWLEREHNARQRVSDAQEYLDFCTDRIDRLIAEAGVERPALRLINGGLNGTVA